MPAKKVAAPIRTQVKTFEDYQREKQAAKPEMKAEDGSPTPTPETERLDWDLAKEWVFMVDKLASDGKMAESIFMKDLQPEEIGDVIHVKVPAESKREMMENLRPRFLDQVRRRCGRNFTMEIEVAAREEVIMRPYTPREILAEMARKNPHIQELIETLRFRV
jgi:hypothetical protein